MVHITQLGHHPWVVRELFFSFHFIITQHKPYVPVVDVPGPWLQPNWWGGRRHPSSPSQHHCWAQRWPSVPSCAAPA